MFKCLQIFHSVEVVKYLKAQFHMSRVNLEPIKDPWDKLTGLCHGLGTPNSTDIPSRPGTLPGGSGSLNDRLSVLGREHLAFLNC